MNLWFTAVILFLALSLLAVELIGVQRKQPGDTITENWRWLDKWLNERAPWLRWFFRIFTAGILIWALGHFLGGWD